MGTGRGSLWVDGRPVWHFALPLPRFLEHRKSESRAGLSALSLTPSYTPVFMNDDVKYKLLDYSTFCVSEGRGFFCSRANVLMWGNSSWLNEPVSVLPTMTDISSLELGMYVDWWYHGITGLMNCHWPWLSHSKLTDRGHINKICKVGYLVFCLTGSDYSEIVSQPWQMSGVWRLPRSFELEELCFIELGVEFVFLFLEIFIFLFPVYKNQ